MVFQLAAVDYGSVWLRHCVSPEDFLERATNPKAGIRDMI